METPDSDPTIECADESGRRVANALERLATRLATESSRTESDVQRVNSLISNATRELVRSFEALRRSTEDQQHQHEKLMERLGVTGEGPAVNLGGLIVGIRSSLTYFGDLVAHYSLETMRINSLVQDVLKDVAEVVRLLRHIDGIADDTGILAINAALEAARAGSVGQGFKVVSSEIRSLAKKTKELDREIWERMQVTIRTSSGVEAALRRMAEQDLTPLVEQSDSVEHMKTHIEALERDMNETLTRNVEYASAVHRSTADAMRAMQFEDIVTQISNAAAQRQTGLSPSTPRCLRDLPPRPTSDDICAAILTALEEPKAHMPAHQETLDEGEFTLF